MRALLQRVLEAHVVVDGHTTGAIRHGLLVFLGLGKDDDLDKGKKLIDKILKYRIFDDENGKMGGISIRRRVAYSLVSQFTLMAQTQKGLRPDFGRRCHRKTPKYSMNNWWSMPNRNFLGLKPEFLQPI